MMFLKQVFIRVLYSPSSGGNNWIEIDSNTADKSLVAEDRVSMLVLLKYTLIGKWKYALYQLCDCKITQVLVSTPIYQHPPAIYL